MIHKKTVPDSKKKIDDLLHPVVKKWFYSKFKEYSLPQRLGVLEIHKRNNVLISAPTGATKTLTSFLSILNELVDSAIKGILQNKIYCVYVSPLKALNYDIEFNLTNPLKEIEEIYGSPLGIKIATRTGDTTCYEKSKMTKNPPHILITTPESLSIVLMSKKFKANLKGVEWLILDEIHALAENKRGTHLNLSVELLERLSPGFARIGLSATVAPIEEIGHFLAGYDFGLDPESQIMPDQYYPRDFVLIDVQFIKKNDLEVLSPVSDFINTDYNVTRFKMYSLMNDLVMQHKTTLIFTNTRAATEKVVDTLKNMFPENYNDDNIGIHHSSLSKEVRFDVEDSLRKGKLRCVVSSTSLELGIDIGFIDLVILLGSPKSVARALQRSGRSGHRLDEVTKSRIIVLNRDDLIECSVLLKNGIDGKIDKVHIPRNALDVLSQQILPFVFEEKFTKRMLFNLLRKSYSFHSLEYKDFNDVLSYLSGEYSDLEDRNVYAKIGVDDETDVVYPRGIMTRVIFMTNVGTIPEESKIRVKEPGKNSVIGYLDESFLEKLQAGDIFVLGGKTYTFRYTRGMVCYVKNSMRRPPTVPSWVSEMLPLSFDLANDINHFRYLVNERFLRDESKEEVIKFMQNYLYVGENTSQAIFNYFKEQYEYMGFLPNDKELVVEMFHDNDKYFMVFHSMFGRRVNDVLSRVFAFYLSTVNKRSFELGINDHAFYIASGSSFVFGDPLKYITPENIRPIAEKTINKTQVLRRRFRHCATRALMILRQYKSKKKSVGRQQMSSEALYRTILKIDENFPIIKEAKREVLEDLMDIENASRVISLLSSGKMQLKQVKTKTPSPFSFNIFMQGISDVLKSEDRFVFLKKLHEMVLAQIMMKNKLPNELDDFSDFIDSEPFDLKEEEDFAFRDLSVSAKVDRGVDENEELRILFLETANRVNLNDKIKNIVFDMIDGKEQKYPKFFINWLTEIVKWDNPVWPMKLFLFFRRKLADIDKK